MADSYTTLQLDTPCTMAEATEWWEEVHRVVGEDNAEVSVVPHTNGTYRITVHIQYSGVT